MDDVETHVIISIKVQKYYRVGVGEYFIFLLTVFGLTFGGSSTVHIYTHHIQNNTMKENTQNRTYITIRIHNLQN